MSSNYGYDANGWEREPFPARDEFIEPRRPAKVAHPECEDCRNGKGTTSPGPGHCKTHDRHCSAAPCW